jgi:Mn-dependent DtxR family transcriptional regulator
MILLESGEMYLETILVLQQRNTNVRSIDISEEMNFSKPSVSRAIKLLKTNGYINVDPSGYITFTDKGEEVAKDIYERHQVLTEGLLYLGVPEDIAAKDACKIEHDLSKETFEAIKKHMAKFSKANGKAATKSAAKTSTKAATKATTKAGLKISTKTTSKAGAKSKK